MLRCLEAFRAGLIFRAAEHPRAPFLLTSEISRRDGGCSKEVVFGGNSSPDHLWVFFFSWSPLLLLLCLSLCPNARQMRILLSQKILIRMPSWKALPLLLRVWGRWPIGFPAKHKVYGPTPVFYLLCQLNLELTLPPRERIDHLCYSPCGPVVKLFWKWTSQTSSKPAVVVFLILLVRKRNMIK